MAGVFLTWQLRYEYTLGAHNDISGEVIRGEHFTDLR